MLLPKILLRQRYFLSFFSTILLIALTTQSSLAFSIIPRGPRGATEFWDPDESYTLANQRRGTTTLSPSAVRNLTRGGSAEFWRTLMGEFPTWTFSVASRPLSGSFEVKIYDAIGTSERVGANFLLEYTPGVGDPTPQNNRLNWIQRVVHNHGNQGHGDYEDIIQNERADSPFFINSTDPWFETNFVGSARQSDTNRNHNWLAELYLVEHIGPQQVRIYNGIQWGWQNRVESVPEPLTIFAAGVSLGFGALFKKTVKGTRQSKTKSLEKLKD